jgi:hypothetical protein
VELGIPVGNFHFLWILRKDCQGCRELPVLFCLFYHDEGIARCRWLFGAAECEHGLMRMS